MLLHRADPQIYKHRDGYYYFMSSVLPDFDRLELRKSKTLTGIKDTKPVDVFLKQPSGPLSHNLWAPEIHYIHNKWYIYFSAAGTPEVFDHRMFVLENNSPDPTQGTWVYKGQIVTNWDSFALDATVFSHRGSLYLVWAQHDPAIAGNTNLYIAKMRNPWTIEGKQVMLSKPDLVWEQQGFWVNEGPAVLKRNGQIFLTYSASSCDPRYLMGMLRASDTSDLLRADSWTKSPVPVFQSNPAAHVYGPGHNSFTVSPDGTEDYLMYHAYSSNTVPTCFGDERSVRMQRFYWRPDGTPDFGQPVSEDVKLPLPSGEAAQQKR
nr:glycoside hydrolase family 43 protein [Paenibacillus rigui]